MHTSLTVPWVMRGEKQLIKITLPCLLHLHIALPTLTIAATSEWVNSWERPSRVLIQTIEVNKLVCRGGSHITGGARSCGISSTHKPLDSKSFHSFSFLSPYQDLFLSAVQASCKLYPPPPENEVVKSSEVPYIYFPLMVSICSHIFLGVDTWGSFGIRVQ